MPWSEKSFLLEVKPQGEYASLYVACVEDDARDIVRIVQNGIDLCSSNELVPASVSNDDDTNISDMVIEKLSDVHLTDEDGGGGPVCKNLDEKENIKIDPDKEINNSKLPQIEHKAQLQESTNNNPSLSAVIKGFQMDPESVKNYSWTDDQQTFSCKLKVDLINSDNEPRTWTEAVKYVRMSTSGLESYCSRLNDCSVMLQCGKCANVFQCDKPSQSLKYYKLPSVEFNEIMDELFCHQHERGAFDNNMMYSYFVNGPKSNQCFVSNSYLLINAEITKGCVVDEKNLILCANCHQHVGCLDISPSSRYFPRKNSYRFYHVCTNFFGKSKDSPPTAPFERSFFDMRYESKEQYFAWFILTECESYSTLYFVIRTLDYHPSVMIWVLDAFTVMSVGRLADTKLEERSICKPFPAVKILYKRLNDEDLNDPFVNGQHTGVAPLYLPHSACEMLLSCLDASCEELPPSCRKLGNFKVGFLPTASEF